MRPVGVLGAGAWGTALAIAAARAGNNVVLWDRDPARAQVTERTRENVGYLPGVMLPPAVMVSADRRTFGEADTLLAAVPAQTLRGTLESFGGRFLPDAPIVICAKGIERATGFTMTAVATAVCPTQPIAVLSGPSFAADVARYLPTAVTLAAASLPEAAAIADRLASRTLRLYHTDDRVGVEIGGAVKNVLAIACGIAEGQGLGASAVAALTARAFAELLRFGRAVGARSETLMGLSGFGDLVLTCRSAQSRNFALGLALGRDGRLASASQGRLAEGALTAPILLARARELGVPMPIVEATTAVLEGSLAVEAAVDLLLARPSKAEREGPERPEER